MSLNQKPKLVKKKPKSSSSKAIFDPRSLTKFSKKDQKVVIEYFMKEAKENLRVIKNVQKNLNVKMQEIVKTVHYIKIFCDNVDAKRAFLYIREIESTLRAGKFPEDKEWAKKLLILYQEVIDEVMKFRDEID